MNQRADSRQAGCRFSAGAVQCSAARLGEVCAVLRVLRQVAGKLLEGSDGKAEHLVASRARRGAPGGAQRLQNVAQRDAQADAGHQAVVDQLPKQQRCRQEARVRG